MACVAATPTPASAHSTPLPTENTRDCTAPPTSPVAGSKPRIENVATGSGIGARLSRHPPAAPRPTAQASAQRRRTSPSCLIASLLVTGRASHGLFAILPDSRPARPAPPRHARSVRGPSRTSVQPPVARLARPPRGVHPPSGPIARVSAGGARQRRPGRPRWHAIAGSTSSARAARRAGSSSSPSTALAGGIDARHDGPAALLRRRHGDPLPPCAALGAHDRAQPHLRSRGDERPHAARRPSSPHRASTSSILSPLSTAIATRVAHAAAPAPAATALAELDDGHAPAAGLDDARVPLASAPVEHPQLRRRRRAATPGRGAPLVVRQRQRLSARVGVRCVGARRHRRIIRAASTGAVQPVVYTAGRCSSATRRSASTSIVAPLGSGGFGTVFLAEDTWIDKKVALKVPHRQTLDFGELLREPRLLATLSHPNIVTVLTAESRTTCSSS